MEIIEVEEARERLLAAIKPIEDTISVPLKEASGCVIAETVVSERAIPHFPKAAMDGYAVCANDTEDATKDNPVRFEVIGELSAGDVAKTVTGRKKAVRIMTGAMVPHGCDAVVMQENTDYGDDYVEVYAPIKPFENYCRIGEDVQLGSEIISAGRKIGRIETGLLAAIGKKEVLIRRPLKIAVLVTGNEILGENDEPVPAGLYDSILPMLRYSIKAEGFLITKEMLLKDNLKEIENSIMSAAENADIVITTGGVSVGKKDFLPKALDNIGAKKLFNRTNIKPGKWTIGSVWNNTVILSLSGNPYAALANFDYYFYHIAARLLDCEELKPTEIKAVSLSSYENKTSVRRWLRGYYNNGEVEISKTGHASSVISNMAGCNCYVDVAPSSSLSDGDIVTIRKTGI